MTDGQTKAANAAGNGAAAGGAANGKAKRDVVTTGPVNPR